jgi:hypothetical protein
MDLDLKDYGKVRLAMYSAGASLHPELTAPGSEVKLYVASLPDLGVTLLSLDGHKGVVEDGDFYDHPEGSYIASALIEKFSLNRGEISAQDKGTVISSITLALDNSKVTLSRLATNEELQARRSSTSADGQSESDDLSGEESSSDEQSADSESEVS